MFGRRAKEYRIIRDGRGGERFPWTVYAPGGTGEPLSIRDLMPHSEMRELDARSGREPAWNIHCGGNEHVADVFRTRRDAKRAVWMLYQGLVFINPVAPLCWRIYQDV